MTPRLASNGLYVDHVLGWAVGFPDADAAGARKSGGDGETRPSRAGQTEDSTATGGATGNSRPRGFRFPRFGR